MRRIATAVAAATLTLTASGAAFASQPAGAAVIGGQSEACGTAMDIIDWTWEQLRKTNSDVKATYLIKLQLAVGDWAIANCGISPM